MEFEKNAPITDEDVALADTPHVTVQPMHGEIKADLADAPLIADAQTKRTFDFEAESTAPAAVSSTRLSSHPQHRTALILAAVTVLLFGGGLFVLYALQ